MEIFLEHLGRGFMSMLMIAMPCVLTAAGIGLVVGILQAVTQVQEQTIAAAPKIVGVFLVIMLMGNLFTRMLKNYFFESANLAFNIIPRRESHVLPPGARSRDVAGFSKNFGKVKTPSIEALMQNPGKIPFAKAVKKIKTLPADNTPRPTINLMEKQKINGQ